MAMTSDNDTNSERDSDSECDHMFQLSFWNLVVVIF